MNDEKKRALRNWSLLGLALAVPLLLLAGLRLLSEHER